MAYCLLSSSARDLGSIGGGALLRCARVREGWAPVPVVDVLFEGDVRGVAAGLVALRGPWLATAPPESPVPFVVDARGYCFLVALHRCHGLSLARER
jgi:hypothetical protein